MTSGTPSKRYLCQAPRPDAWDDHAEEVLKNLGGSRDKRIASIRETLVRAKRRNPFTPKAGPGRKTNLEHAIAFYEHLLEKLGATPQEHDAMDTTREKDESEDDDDDAEEAMEEESLQSDESTPCTKKAGAVDSQLCEVCDEQGELVTCSECNLRFHKMCVRPVMTALPDAATWRCSYCVLSTEPKNSKPRREAAAAVRMMARLRNRHRRTMGALKRSADELRSEEGEAAPQEHARLQGEGNDKIEISLKAATPIETPPTSRRVRNEPDRSSSKNRDLEEKTPSTLSIDTDESHGRVKRARKQPALYDPQLCPASKWESDVRAKKTTLAHSDTSDDDTASAKKNAASTTSARRDEEEKDEDVWCNFCGDDPRMKVCCFCACRVCFGKHHQTRLLLCDRCDDEYHTFCLDPPLESVPKRNGTVPIVYLPKNPVWIEHQVESKRGASLVSPALLTIVRLVYISRRTQTSHGTCLAGFYHLGQARVATNHREPPHPRKPESGDGRLPRTSLLDLKKKTIKDGSSKGRRSGSSQDADKVLKSPGRKHATYGDSSNTPSEPVSVTVSRSGRTVKRNSFHDEIDPCEQHLRSTSHSYATIQHSSAGLGPSEISEPVLAAHSSGCQLEGARNVQVPLTSDLMVTSHVEGIDPKTRENDPEDDLISDTKEHPTAESSLAVVQGSRLEPYLPSGASIDASNPAEPSSVAMTAEGKVPRRKPGARECMQISRRFGADVIPQKYIDTLLDYCKRGKVEHLIRMRERLDDHARFLESQLAGLEARLAQTGPDTNVTSTNQQLTVSSEAEAEEKNP